MYRSGDNLAEKHTKSEKQSKVSCQLPGEVQIQLPTATELISSCCMQSDAVFCKLFLHKLGVNNSIRFTSNTYLIFNHVLACGHIVKGI